MSDADDSSDGSVATRLSSIREGLLGGRGPGASAAEISALTRNRVEVAGMTATRRLELAARQTARARGDADAIAAATQLRAAEVAGGLHTNDRLGPTPSTHRSPQVSRPSPRQIWAVVGLVGAAAAWMIRRRLHD